MLSTSKIDVLNIFQTGRSHLAVVSPDAATLEGCWARGEDAPPTVDIRGVCTIEDVIEEMIGEEVLDESDLDRCAQPTTEAARAEPFGNAHPLLAAAP